MTSTKLHPTRWVEWTHDGGTRQGRVVCTTFIGFERRAVFEDMHVVESFGEFFEVKATCCRDVVLRREWENNEPA